MLIKAGLLSRALRIVSVSSQGSQVTEKPSVLLIAAGRKLVCRTTDLGLFTEAVISAKKAVTSPMAVLGVLGPLLTFAGAQNEDALVDIRLGASEIGLSSGSDRAKVKTLDRKSFSSWPGAPDFKPMAAIDAQPLVRAMKDVVFSASSALVTPELYAVHVVIDSKKGMASAEAADGRRYCRMVVPVKKGKAVLDVMIPLRVVQELESAEGAKVGILKNFMCIRYVQDGVLVTMWCRTLVGNYPHVTEMLPTKFRIVARVDSKEFDRRLLVCMAYADDTERDVELSVGNNVITMKARDASSGAYATQVKCAKSKGEGTILLDSKHLHEFSQGAGSLVVKINGPKDVLIAEDEEREGLLYAMWPLTRVEKKEESKETIGE